MDETLRKYPELKKYLAEFIKSITSNLSTKSIILFGGIMLDDFSKRYSDIDIIVVLNVGLNEKNLESIDEVITKLRIIDPELTRILYVYFIPSFMLDSSKVKFKGQKGLIIGNEKAKPINRYPLSIMDNFSVREKGKILFGEDLKKQFPKPPENLFWQMFIDSLSFIEEATKKHPFQHSEKQNDHTTINWLLYFPRLLYSLIKKDLIGKSDSAFWFQKEYNNSLGEFLIEIGKCRQENAFVYDIKDLVLNSRKLILFTFEKILEIKGIDANLSSLVSIDLNRMNFNPIFREFKDLIQK